MQENKKNNLICRIGVALLLIPLVLGAIFFSKLLLQIIILIVAFGMFVEWYDMTSESKYYMILGLPIISIPIVCLMLMTMVEINYQYIFLTYVSIIWTVDSAAMFGGRKFEGPELAPVLSPNKTWSGLLTGMLGASVVTLCVSQIPGYMFIYRGVSLFIFASVLAFVAQMSDLFISFFKRKFHIKDTGSIIPGHGGILDRCDSMILTAPIMLLVLLIA